MLQVPRGDAKAGRYQSAPLDFATVKALVEAYAAFFEGDARHNLWLASPKAELNLVYDEHNLIYAYGDLDGISSRLDSLGFVEGHEAMPVPHTHPFHEEFDEAQDRLATLEDFWRITPLTPADER